jgi:hypothetical protein
MNERALEDLSGQDIWLTGERLAHILEHPEMAGQEERIPEALRSPDSVVLSHHDPAVRLYHKLFETTPVTRKYLVVAVKYTKQDALVVTAFFTDRATRGLSTSRSRVMQPKAS